ncbi:hypothetical protein [Halomarina rubra]|uniref:Uncharacterized protein n=1 Tax=Halomarina rubra TaxID=2071873 RepID=A0ABD6B239_9EURY|nr:hypothetical protein [Halomarina rubra]
MSTTPESATATAAVFERRERITPADLFDHFVFYSDEWCSACFERIRRVGHTVATDTDSLGTEGNVLESRQRVGAGCLGYDYTTHDSHGEVTVRNDEGQVVGTEPRGSYGLQRTYSTRTYCGGCGANNGHAPDLTISKREAVRRADQLVDCLLAQGVPVNRAALKHVVATAKERPDLADRDHDIFEQATAYARREYVRQLD